MANWHCSVHDAWGVAISPSEKILATGGEDGSIRLWSVPELLHENDGTSNSQINFDNLKGIGKQ